MALCNRAYIMAIAYLTCSPKDREAARLLAASLSREGVRVELLDDLDDEGAMASVDRRCLLVLVSPEGERSERVRAHIARALNNAWPIIPVVVSGIEASSWMRLALPASGEIDITRGLAPGALQAAAEAVRLATSTGRPVAMLNIKGGVGKTVLAANLFAAAHLYSQTRVVFIDLDPQSNLTQYFLAAGERNRLRQLNRTIYSVFSTRGEAAGTRADFVYLPTPLNRKLGEGHFDLIAGDERLFEFTLDLKPAPEKDLAFLRFHDLVAALRARYDVVVIDTNPCATFLTRCAITAVEHIVAPVRPERYSLTGLNMLEFVARQIRERPVRPAEFSLVLNGIGDRQRLRSGGDPDALARQEIQQAPFFSSTLLPAAVPYSALLRAAPNERYAANPINLTALQRFAQRPLREALINVAQAILQRAGAP